MKKNDGSSNWLWLIDMAEVAVRIGLISSAAVVAALGQFVLSAILLFIAFGIFLRFKRKKKT